VSAPPSLPIRTERLTLRAWTSDDLAALLDMTSRPDAVRYVPFPPRDADSAAKALHERLGWGIPDFDADGQVLALAVEHADSRQLVGDVVLMFRTLEHHDAEIGFIFHPDHQRRGYATEACRAVLSVAFDHYGLHRVFARLDARNTASARLLDRLGMRAEGRFIENEWFKGEWTDEVAYAILDREHAAQHGSPS